MKFVLNISTEDSTEWVEVEAAHAAEAIEIFAVEMAKIEKERYESAFRAMRASGQYSEESIAALVRPREWICKAPCGMWEGEIIGEPIKYVGKMGWTDSHEKVLKRAKCDVPVRKVGKWVGTPRGRRVLYGPSDLIVSHDLKYLGHD